jgi:hypothetical protein
MNKANRAHAKVREALKNGLLTKPDICELCGRDARIILHTVFGPCEARIVAHHWRGYDYPFEIWWICRSCNVKLVGESFHNGTIDKERALAIVNSWEWRTIGSAYRAARDLPFTRKIIKRTDEEIAAGATDAMRAAFGEKAK